MPGPAHSILFFDGLCYLCSWAVKLVLTHDHTDRVRIAPLQDKAFRHLLPGLDLQDAGGSIVLLEGTLVFSESTAIIRLGRHLGGFWNLVFLAALIPRSLRDRLYRFVAANRYRVFGRRESCLLPPPRRRQKFQIPSSLPSGEPFVKYA